MSNEQKTPTEKKSSSYAVIETNDGSKLIAEISSLEEVFAFQSNFPMEDEIQELLDLLVKAYARPDEDFLEICTPENFRNYTSILLTLRDAFKGLKVEEKTA